LLKGPLAPGSPRLVHVTAKLPDETPASAKCESKKYRVQWVLWSQSSEVNPSAVTKEKWAKLDGKFDHAGDCGRYREAYRKRLGELRKKHPGARRRCYILLYSAGGKRRRERFQCAKAGIDLNR
ncbi:MAG: hypothetical protein QF701_12995, partial [Nitrospinota bacterium]|nr:hypothetical protein [Nitrospinota bacterium]